MVHSFTVYLSQQRKTDMKFTTAILTDVLTALSAKGIKYELTGECSKISWYEGAVLEDGTFYGVDLGIALGRGIWAWYRIGIDFDTCEANSVCFRQRYNQNVGTVLKSFRTSQKVGEAIEKLTGVNLSRMY